MLTLLYYIDTQATDRHALRIVPCPRRYSYGPLSNRSVKWYEYWNRGASYYSAPCSSRRVYDPQVPWQNPNPYASRWTASQYNSCPTSHEPVLISDECDTRSEPNCTWTVEYNCQKCVRETVATTEAPKAAEKSKPCLSLDEYPGAMRSSSPARVALPENSNKGGNDFLLLPLAAAANAAKLHITRSCLEGGEVVIYIKEPEHAFTITGAVTPE